METREHDYRRALRERESLPPRVRGSVRLTPEWCLDWTGTASRGQYPKIKVQGDSVMVGRYVSARMHGPIPTGLVVLHWCRSSVRVRPTHLFLATRSAAYRLRQGQAQLTHQGGVPGRPEAAREATRPVTGATS